MKTKIKLMGMLIIPCIMMLVLTGCSASNEGNNKDKETNDLVGCSLSLKYADYMDGFNFLNVDSSSEKSVIKKLDEKEKQDDNCERINLNLSDLNLDIVMSYSKENGDYTIDKIKYDVDSVNIDKNIKFLVLQKIEEDVIVNVTDDSYLIGNAILIKDNQLYSLSDIDLVTYENGGYTYTKYNHNYINILQHACDNSIGLTDADMKNVFEEQGNLTFDGTKHTLNKTKTITVAKQCGVGE